MNKRGAVEPVSPESVATFSFINSTPCDKAAGKRPVNADNLELLIVVRQVW